MVKIEIEPGKTVDTIDPQVRITVSPTPSLVASAFKVVLVVETEDGRRSVPTEVLLGVTERPPA
jgi:hypothetical protein